MKKERETPVFPFIIFSCRAVKLERMDLSGASSPVSWARLISDDSVTHRFVPLSTSPVWVGPRSQGRHLETARADTQPGQAYESPLRLLDISTQNESECEKFIYIVSRKFGISIYRIQYKLFLILFKYYLEALALSLKIWLIYLSATKLRLLSQIRKQEEANQLNQFILRRAL